MRIQKRKSNSKGRLATGQAIAEGMAFLVILVPLIVGTVLLLANVGLSVFYKEKLVSVTNACAFFAAVRLGQHQEPERVKTATEEVVNASLKEMGLPEASKVVLKLTPPADPKLVSLTVEVAGLRLLGRTNMFPDFIGLSDRSSVPITEVAPYPDKVVTLFFNRPGQPAIRLAGFEPSAAKFPNGFYTQGVSIARTAAGYQISHQNPDNYINSAKYTGQW